jgi:hypothetical protein
MSAFDRGYAAEMKRLEREEEARGAAKARADFAERTYKHKHWCASENGDDTGYGPTPKCNCKPHDFET